jgi:hypothetical protein
VQVHSKARAHGVIEEVRCDAPPFDSDDRPMDSGFGVIRMLTGATSAIPSSLGRVASTDEAEKVKISQCTESFKVMFGVYGWSKKLCHTCKAQ